jgi:1,4-alpha-glucan branching enzyme
MIVCNFTPVPRNAYRVGVSHGGVWNEILNSDGEVYGGTGVGNRGQAVAEEVPVHGRQRSLLITLPPLGVLFFRRDLSGG